MDDKQYTSDATLIQQASLLLNYSLDMPWAAVNELKRIVLSPWYRLLFSLHGIRWKKGWHIYGMPFVQRFRGSEIVIGDHVWLRSWKSSNPLVPTHPITFSTRSKNASIRIGDHANLTATILVAAERIEIGNHVWIGSNTTIVDTDFHPLEAQKRLTNPLDAAHDAVIIEDDVFIGMNCIILKGTCIHKGSVVGAGSVVVGEIPSGVVAAGNPAQVIGEIH